MCFCRNIEVGSYDNQILVVNPFTDKTVGIDACILPEVVILWNLGIETIESCCGHNKQPGYIAVKEEYVSRMEIELNYDFDDRTDAPGVFLSQQVILKEGIGG